MYDIWLSYRPARKVTAQLYLNDAPYNAAFALAEVPTIGEYYANVQTGTPANTYVVVFFDGVKKIVSAVLNWDGAKEIVGASLAQIEASSVLAKEATVATRASQASVSAIPTNPVLVTDTRLNNLDAAVSTRLPAASYVAPTTAPSAADNATAVRTNLAIELARLDAAISTRLATSGYTAPDNVSVAAIKAKTDTLVNGPSLAQIEASNVLAKEATLSPKASQASVTSLAASITTAPTVAQIRAELETANSKLDRAMRYAKTTKRQTL